MKKPFYYGGQAVIEGVMMMGPEGYAVSVRCPTVRSSPAKKNITASRNG